MIFILSVCADNGWVDVGKIHWHVLDYKNKQRENPFYNKAGKVTHINLLTSSADDAHWWRNQATEYMTVI